MSVNSLQNCQMLESEVTLENISLVLDVGKLSQLREGK